jgi:hypothetical protein
MAFSYKQALLKISIIVSVIMIFISYFDLYRYFIMHYKDPITYLKNYNGLETADSDCKVVIFINRKNNKLLNSATINSLLDQTVKVDEMCIVVPLDEDKTSYPKYLNVYSSDNEFKCTMKRERNSTTKIIVVENGIVYKPDFVEELVEYSKENPNTIVDWNHSKPIGLLYTPSSISTNYTSDADIPNDIRTCVSKYRNVDYRTMNRKLENYTSFKN